MLILVLNRSCYLENIALIEETKERVEGYELPLDLLKENSIQEIEQIRNVAKLPIIFTWKSSFYNTSLIRILSKLQPDFFDFDYTAPISIINEVVSISPTTKIIVSVHDYVQTPSDLVGLLLQIKRIPAYLYKMATFATSITDSLRMMHFMMEYSSRERLIGICMGKAGQVTRIAAPIIGSRMHYCYSGVESAPGQFSLDELLDVYLYKRIDRNTQILALIGNPVCYSPSHYTHNWIFSKMEWPAIYVKLQLGFEELPTFCTLFKKLPFLGCSVTMPFKKAIIPFLDCTTEMVNITQSVNTIHKKDTVLYGHNFDALGALDSIEEKISVFNQHIVILGGGGTAKSIAAEAKERGAKVTMLNRSLDKIINFASQLQIRCGRLEDFEKVAIEGYDIICNATCLGMGETLETPVPIYKLLSNKYIMDVVFALGHTAFTSGAKKLNCSIIYGKTMFVKQAICQMRTWFSENIDRSKVEKVMMESMQKYLNY